MHIPKTTTLVSTVFIGLLLSACGGGSSSPLNPKPSTSAGATSSINTTLPNNIGRGSGSNFVAGEIAVGEGTTDLPAGGTTSLTVNIVSSTNNLVTTAVEVTFNSRCYAEGAATLKKGSIATNKVSTEIGQATISYSATGCSGADEITATAILNGQATVARVTLDIATDTIQSISFVDVTPSQIYLKGSGNTETAVVRFQVLGKAGAPIKDVDLDFALTTTVGGITLTSATGKTDTSGYATTTVQAGTIPTSVQVIAKEKVSGINAQSNELTISTGLPDQNSMSISASRFNPPGWNHDNEKSTINILLADAFNNPPPDGTAVYFTTEGGAIDPSCVTIDGACSVSWRSQKSRPHNGRVTILATTIGNESFIDEDFDGLYTAGVDTFSTFNTPITEGNCNPNTPISTAASNGSDHPCDDLAEAYVDKNENGVRDEGEEAIDFNQNGKYDTENGIYNGVLCKTEGEGCTKEAVTIREDIVLVMSSDYPYTDTSGLLPGQPSEVTLGVDESYSFVVSLADINGNAMPAGTTISLITNSASDVTVTHNMPSSGVANTTQPTRFSVTLKGSKTALPSGNFAIAVKSPYLETTYTTSIRPRPANEPIPKYLGKGSGSTFISGVIDVSIGDTVLAPGGSTNLSVSIVDEDFDIASVAAQLTFTSPCIESGTAKLTDSGGTETKTASAIGGKATLTYTAIGCIGTDEVTATSNLTGMSINTASSILNIAEASAQSIEFFDATPEQISLSGTGGTETSIVRFLVKGPSGTPVSGVSVTLTLNNTLGGLCLTNGGSTCLTSITAVSNKDGYVSAIVKSGSIATTVRVTATASGVSTQSNRLVVSTGIPDQDSMSLSATTYNPKGWNHEGVEVPISIRMADAFNNPVPVGTIASFTTSGGRIDDSCTIDEKSTCTVTWVSQAPRPSNGKVTILATALGNESFIDTNGSGYYEIGDIFSLGNSTTCAPNAPVSSAVSRTGACDDLGEAFLDSNQSKAYDLSDGYFVDIFGTTDGEGKPKGDGLRTAADGKYNGALCKNPATGDCTKDSVTVRQEIYLVMSSDYPETSGGRLLGQPASVTIAATETKTFVVTLRDINGNSMPSGTKVSINSANAANVTINHDLPVAGVANTTAGTTFTVTLKASATLAPTGSFSILVEAPDAVTSYSTNLN
jgi:hypothetical protein